MVRFPTEIWFTLALLAASGILAMLYSLASYVRGQQLVHDTRTKAAHMRHHYLANLDAERRQGAPEDWSDVEIVEEVPDAPYPFKEAA
jgi:hypothetical protein